MVEGVSEVIFVMGGCSEGVGRSAFGTTVFLGCLAGSIELFSLTFMLPASHSSTVTAGVETNSSGNKSP